jgi:HD-like signal output (HDOD) protein/GGDEF domain-containing protein
VEASLKAKLERCTTLPTLPAVALKVLDLCQRENLDLPEIAKVIANDPALAAKMLKTVNSPAFALRQEVRTLSHAVALLGVNSVRTLVLSFSLLRDIRKSQRASLTTYWKRSVLAGVAARELAGALRFAYREEAFLCGLLQDIGMLALRQLNDPIYNDLLESASWDHDRLAAGERASFESDHSEVGAWLIARWRLPDRFRLACASSHKTAKLEKADDDLAVLLQLTALSGILADIWIHPDAAGAAQRAHIQVGKVLQLPGLSLEEVVRNMAAALPDVAALFEVDLGSQESLARVLEDAREALAVISVQGLPAPRLVPPPIPAEATADARKADGTPRDPATDLPDRGTAERYLAEERVLARRENEPVSVVIADIDDATWMPAVASVSEGGGTGERRALLPDTVLRAVANCLGDRLRKRDLLARIGPSRFLFILPETNTAGAVVVAERARGHIMKLDPVAIGAGGPLTMSFGSVTSPPDDSATAAELIGQALLGAAAARAAGGNRVQVQRGAEAVTRADAG